MMTELEEDELEEDELLDDDEELLEVEDELLDEDDEELLEDDELEDEEPDGDEDELDDDELDGLLRIGESRLSHAADRNPVASIAAPPESSRRKRRRASRICWSRVISSLPMGLILLLRTQARRSRSSPATRLRNTTRLVG